MAIRTRGSSWPYCLYRTLHLLPVNYVRALEVPGRGGQLFMSLMPPEPSAHTTEAQRVFAEWTCLNFRYWIGGEQGRGRLGCGSPGSFPDHLCPSIQAVLLRGVPPPLHRKCFHWGKTLCLWNSRMGEGGRRFWALF